MLVDMLGQASRRRAHLSRDERRDVGARLDAFSRSAGLKRLMPVPISDGWPPPHIVPVRVRTVP